MQYAWQLISVVLQQSNVDSDSVERCRELFETGTPWIEIHPTNRIINIADDSFRTIIVREKERGPKVVAIMAVKYTDAEHLERFVKGEEDAILLITEPG
jgi:hypothetical protein